MVNLPVFWNRSNKRIAESNRGHVSCWQAQQKVDFLLVLAKLPDVAKDFVEVSLIFTLASFVSDLL